MEQWDWQPIELLQMSVTYIGLHMDPSMQEDGRVWAMQMDLMRFPTDMIYSFIPLSPPQFGLKTATKDGLQGLFMWEQLKCLH